MAEKTRKDADAFAKAGRDDTGGGTPWRDERSARNDGFSTSFVKKSISFPLPLSSPLSLLAERTDMALMSPSVDVRHFSPVFPSRNGCTSFPLAYWPCLPNVDAKASRPDQPDGTSQPVRIAIFVPSRGPADEAGSRTAGHGRGRLASTSIADNLFNLPSTIRSPKMAAVVIYGLTAVALHGLDVSAFAPPIVSSATCHASHRSLPSLSRRLVRGDAATLGTASSARLLPSSSSFGRCCRREESPLALGSTKPGRSGGRGRGRGQTQGRGRGRGRGRGTTRRSGPDFRTCRDVAELADLAHRSLDSMSNRDIAAFWSLLPRLLHKHGVKDPNLKEKLM
ncbi:hypothetical protein THAOC_21582, partial [Thalassiosira oceanica]